MRMGVHGCLAACLQSTALRDSGPVLDTHTHSDGTRRLHTFRACVYVVKREVRPFGVRVDWTGVGGRTDPTGSCLPVAPHRVKLQMLDSKISG